MPQRGVIAMRTAHRTNFLPVYSKFPRVHSQRRQMTLGCVTRPFEIPPTRRTKKPSTNDQMERPRYCRDHKRNKHAGGSTHEETIKKSRRTYCACHRSNARHLASV